MLDLIHRRENERLSHVFDPTKNRSSFLRRRRRARPYTRRCIFSPFSCLSIRNASSTLLLFSIVNAMQNTQVCHILSKDELPIEIDVGQEHRYHSVFACPILRQQTTDQNPPMKLVCGHVISKDALNKLSIQNRLKCPYCPLGESLAPSPPSR